jgi:hypothetical protein
MDAKARQEKIYRDVEGGILPETASEPKAALVLRNRWCATAHPDDK